MIGGNVTKFLMFTKESCGPCGLVKKYSVTATPVLLVIKGDDEDCVLEELVGGMNITQNIRRLWETYYD